MQRKVRIPAVDWSNPYLRELLKTYPQKHKAVLDDVRRRLPEWTAKARRSEDGKRPLAAVFDIDETILCNLHLGEHVTSQVDFHSADFLGWPRGSRLNPLLPGARDILDAARQLDLALFFISGRPEAARDETVENFAAVGLAAGSRPLFAIDDLKHSSWNSTKVPILILRPDADYQKQGSVRPYKENSRREIEKTHRIVLNIGDQASDLGYYSDVAAKIPNEFYWVA